MRAPHTRGLLIHGGSSYTLMGYSSQDVTVPASEAINFFYHSSTHNLFVGSSKCAYTTEICPSATADTISESSPCKFTPGKPGKRPRGTPLNDCLYCCTCMSKNSMATALQPAHVVLHYHTWVAACLHWQHEHLNMSWRLAVNK